MPSGQQSGQPPDSSRGNDFSPVSTSSIRFRHVIGGLLSLPSLSHTGRDHVSPFPQRSPPRLLTVAACGGLEPAPDGRLRRTYLHLLHSIAPPCVGTFVAHRRRQTIEHDPEKACPGLDPGWTPVFRKDHAPPNTHFTRLTSARPSPRQLPTPVTITCDRSGGLDPKSPVPVGANSLPCSTAAHAMPILATNCVSTP